MLNEIDALVDTASVPDTVREWFQTHTFVAADFPPEAVAEKKAALGLQATLVLPTRNVRSTIGPVLRGVAALTTPSGPLLDQILVVDANSTDGTADVAASLGAEVWSEDALAPSFGPVLGKGDAMWRSLVHARGDIVVFADADTVDFNAGLVGGILGALVFLPRIKFVKAAYRRPYSTIDRSLVDEGGRVTELTARPLLNLFFPSLAGFVQPLAGEFGAWRDVLESVPFVTGYGVESGLLIDVCDRVGLDGMGQVDVGHRQNRHQPLHDLSRMSFAVARTILNRAERVRSLPPREAAANQANSSPLGVYLQATATTLGPRLTEHHEMLVERPPQSPRANGSISMDGSVALCEAG